MLLLYQYSVKLFNRRLIMKTNIVIDNLDTNQPIIEKNEEFEQLLSSLINLLEKDDEHEILVKQPISELKAKISNYLDKYGYIAKDKEGKDALRIDYKTGRTSYTIKDNVAKKQLYNLYPEMFTATLTEEGLKALPIIHPEFFDKKESAPTFAYTFLNKKAKKQK